MPILLFIFVIPIVIVWVLIDMSPPVRKWRQIAEERAAARKPFCKSCVSRGLDILPAKRYEKMVIGKKIFIREFVRSIPAIFAWTVFSLMPLALVKDNSMLFLGGIGFVILLWLITLRYYLIHPFALLSGSFDLYGGLCQDKHESESESSTVSGCWATMNSYDVDIDHIRYKPLRIGYYYYIVEFRNERKHLFLKADDEVAESRINR